MTAAASPRDRFAAPPVSAWQRLLEGPRQGWLSVFLLGVMLYTAGVAIDDARWVGGAPLGGSQTAFLPALFLIAGVAGLLFAQSRLSTGRAHLLAAVLGAGALLVTTANSISSGASMLARLRALSDSFGLFVTDVFVLGARSTETSAFLLVMGAIAFTTGYFSAFNVFRRNRGMPAVTALGLVLLVNMSITVKVQYVHLIVLSLAAMLLLIRLNLVQQEQGWRRRHIAGSEAGALLLRSGALFVAFTLVGAIVLAATASSAPLQSFWRNLDDPLVSVAVAINRLVGGVTGTTRQAGGLFGSAETIRSVWESSDQPVFRVSTTDNGAYYWRGAIYDDFDGLTWSQSDRVAHSVAANTDLLAGSPELIAPGSPFRKTVTARITSLSLAGGTLLAPETPLKADRDAVVRTIGPGGPPVLIALGNAIDPGQSYTVSASVPITDNARTGVTANMLAAAGRIYPDWVRPYLTVRPNALGPISYDTVNRLVANLPPDLRDPYHIALAVQSFFDTNGGFVYTTDVRGVCGRESVVDCLLLHKRGFCQHYAAAMTMLLRTQGIPARFVEGYLPGRELPDKSRQVDASAAHAWVEVFFPGYGWLRFDPTPGNTGNGRTATVLPAGPAVVKPAQSPGPSGATPQPTIREPGFPEPNGPNNQPLPRPAAPDSGISGPLAVTGLLSAAVILVLVATLRRRRVAPPGPDAAYERMARLAARLGYAARPAQTAYEYAGALGEVLPGIRGELFVVAHAKVESTYGRRVASGSTVIALRDAYRKVRVGLLRLLVRRQTKRRRGLGGPAP